MNYKKIISATLKQALVLFILLIAISLVITPLYAKNKSTLRIGLTKGKATENNERYINWLKSINPKIEIIEIYPMGRAAELQKLDSCDGLLLSGGDDIFPGRYGQPADTVRCQLEPPRDTMEFFLIEKAVAKKLPILGICRGMQILNVAFGGSLIVDIPADVPGAITHRCPKPSDCKHPVTFSPKTLNRKIVKKSVVEVNTNHHQAVGNLSPQFVITSSTSDGIPESMEWKEPKGKSFLIAVQWHPERLPKTNSASYPIGRFFLEQAKRFKK